MLVQYPDPSSFLEYHDRQLSEGSWLCENANTINRDRRGYSSKTALVAARASGLNLEVELENIILRRGSIFEFLHNQGQSRHFGRRPTTSGLPLVTDIVRVGRHVSNVPKTDIGLSGHPTGSADYPEQPTL